MDREGELESGGDPLYIEPNPTEKSIPVDQVRNEEAQGVFQSSGTEGSGLSSGGKKKKRIRHRRNKKKIEQSKEDELEGSIHNLQETEVTSSPASHLPSIADDQIIPSEQIPDDQWPIQKDGDILPSHASTEILAPSKEEQQDVSIQSILAKAKENAAFLPAESETLLSAFPPTSSTKLEFSSEINPLKINDAADASVDFLDQSEQGGNSSETITSTTHRLCDTVSDTEASLGGSEIKGNILDIQASCVQLLLNLKPDKKQVVESQLNDVPLYVYNFPSRTRTDQMRNELEATATPIQQIASNDNEFEVTVDIEDNKAGSFSQSGSENNEIITWPQDLNVQVFPVSKLEEVAVTKVEIKEDECNDQDPAKLLTAKITEIMTLDNDNMDTMSMNIVHVNTASRHELVNQDENERPQDEENVEIRQPNLQTFPNEDISSGCPDFDQIEMSPVYSNQSQSHLSGKMGEAEAETMKNRQEFTSFLHQEKVAAPFENWNSTINDGLKTEIKESVQIPQINRLNTSNTEEEEKSVCIAGVIELVPSEDSIEINSMKDFKSQDEDAEGNFVVKEPNDVESLESVHGGRMTSHQPLSRLDSGRERPESRGSYCNVRPTEFLRIGTASSTSSKKSLVHSRTEIGEPKISIEPENYDEDRSIVTKVSFSSNSSQEILDKIEPAPADLENGRRGAGTAVQSGKGFKDCHIVEEKRRGPLRAEHNVEVLPREEVLEDSDSSQGCCANLNFIRSRSKSSKKDKKSRSRSIKDRISSVATVARRTFSKH